MSLDPIRNNGHDQDYFNLMFNFICKKSDFPPHLHARVVMLPRFFKPSGRSDRQTCREQFPLSWFFLAVCLLVFVSKLVKEKQRQHSHIHTHTNLSEFLLIQIPFFDAVVSGAAEQHISLHGQALNAIIVWWLKVMSWTYITQSSLCHIKHLARKEQNGKCLKIFY